MPNEESHSDPHDENQESVLRLHFGNDVLQSDEILSSKISERLEDNFASRTSSIVANPKDTSRWDYHAQVRLYGPEGLYEDEGILQTGICVSSKLQDDGSLEITVQGAKWELERAIVAGFETFGMTDTESVYWLTLLTALVPGIDIPGLEIDRTLRPFTYAIPIRGLTANGVNKSILFQDLIIVSGDSENVFGPLLANTHFGNSEPAWKSDVPKASGVVFAHDFIEAENLALDRAQFTADVVNFALSTGVSHFETRYDTELLEWDADIGRSNVSLEPWIILREIAGIKGWVRSIPLIYKQTTSDINDGSGRLEMFIGHFGNFARAGNILDQTGQKELSGREHKLSAGVQSSLRWLAVAADEDTTNDQFISSWVALEAILNSIEYPGLFGGNRRAIRETLETAIESMNLPSASSNLLTISHELIQGRLFNDQWPLQTKLVLFGRSFSVKIGEDDLALVRLLNRERNRVLHAGRNNSPVSREQVRRLRYLIERLIIAASVFGYEDVEDNDQYQFQFREIGPEGGAAPLFIDGREVPYDFTMSRNEEGEFVMEIVAEGKVYEQKNVDILPMSQKQIVPPIAEGDDG